MSNLFRFLFLLSLTSYITCTKEIHLSCDEDKHAHPKENVKYCYVAEFNVTEKDTKLVFDHNNDYTGVVMSDSKFEVFPTQIIDLFPHVTYIAVAFSGMTKIDDHTFSNASQVTELELQYNKLTEITEFTFDGAVNLVHLYLRSNKISNIHPNAFHSLTKLKKLFMEFNKITEVDRNLFAPLKNLKELYLPHNKISKIDPKALTHNSKLKDLNLGSNKFDTVELELSTKLMKTLDIATSRKIGKLTLRKSPDTTDEVTVIEELALRFSKFSSFADLTFDDKIQVKNLELSHNKITSLAVVPDFLCHVTELELDFNKISEIPPEFVKKLENVEIVVLSNNPLKTSANMFEPLKNLKTLELKHNNFTSLQLEWFTGLNKLERLNFRDNNVTSFDYMGLMNTLPALKRLEIDENLFTCGYLKQMVADLKSIGRLDVIAVRDGEQLEEVDDIGNHIYEIRCDKHLRDKHGFSYTYLKHDYGF